MAFRVISRLQLAIPYHLTLRPSISFCMSCLLLQLTLLPPSFPKPTSLPSDSACFSPCLSLPPRPSPPSCRCHRFILPSVSLCSHPLCPSLSLSHTHTHAHTHNLSVPVSALVSLCSSLIYQRLTRRRSRRACGLSVLREYNGIRAASTVFNLNRKCLDCGFLTLIHVIRLARLTVYPNFFLP